MTKESRTLLSSLIKPDSMSGDVTVDMCIPSTIPDGVSAFFTVTSVEEDDVAVRSWVTVMLVKVADWGRKVREGIVMVIRETGWGEGGMEENIFLIEV